MSVYSFTIACPCSAVLTVNGDYWGHLLPVLDGFQQRHETCRFEAMLALARPAGPKPLAGKFMAKAVCHVCTTYVDDASGRFPCGHNDERNAQYLEEKQDAA